MESLFKMRLQKLQRRCFLVNYSKYLGTYFVEHLGTVASETYTLLVS